MSNRIQHRSLGFTLLELLVVLAIIVALFAILAPAVMSYRNKSNINITKSWIGNFDKALQTYVVDHGNYPTTEQGLNALIFVPMNEGQQTAGTMPQVGLANPNDPNAGMNMGATGVGGVDSFNNPGAMGGMPGMPGDPNNPMGGGANAVGGMPPMGGAPGATPGMPGMNDPNMMGGMNPMGGGMTGDPNMMGGMNGANPMGGALTGFGSTWTQPFFNPQLYTVLKKRSDPYLTGDAVPLDPWQQPYRYEMNLVNGVNQRTGERNKPAIWSAGPDKTDFTEDDIMSWDPKVAAQQLALQQQQMQMGGGMGGVGGVDAMGNPIGGAQPGMPGGDMMNGMPQNPMGGTMPGGMPQNPMGGTMPGGMPQQPMGGAMPGGMPQNPMGGAMPGGMPPQPMGGAMPGGMPPQPMGGAMPGGMPPQPPM